MSPNYLCMRTGRESATLRLLPRVQSMWVKGSQVCECAETKSFSCNTLLVDGSHFAYKGRDATHVAHAYSKKPEKQHLTKKSHTRPDAGPLGHPEVSQVGVRSLIFKLLRKNFLVNVNKTLESRKCE